MATAKPKVKRMMFGGAAKGVAASMQGAAKQAAASKTAPKQMQFMSDKLRGAPMAPPRGPMAPPRPGTAGPRSAPPPAFPAKSKPQQVPSQLASLAKAYNAQKSGSMGIGSQAASKTGLGNAIRGLGAAATGAGRALGMGKKKGGAVKKKATKK